MMNIDPAELGSSIKRVRQVLSDIESKNPQFKNSLRIEAGASNGAAGKFRTYLI
jgi:hypothetical protein